MSRLNKSASYGTPMAGVVSALALSIKEQGTQFASVQDTEHVLSMESLQPHEFENLRRHSEGLQDSIRTSFESLYGQVSMENNVNGGEGGTQQLTDTQLEAGAIAALAAGNPVEYARQALNNRASAADGVEVVVADISGAGGSLDFRDTPSLEAFDERELKAFLPYSIAFNVQASRQDDFSELFYPTTVVTPEQAGLEVTVRRTTVYNAVHHSRTGQATDFKMRNLVDAAVDYTVLADESTAAIPVVQVDGASDEFFVDPALVAPTTRVISGFEIPTAPLKMGATVNLIGISQHPSLIGAGIMDHTDALDGPVALARLYIQTAETDGDVVSFDTLRLPTSTFLKSYEGQSRSANLTFRSNDLVLNAATRAHDGSEADSLALIRTNNYTVRLSVGISGEVNLQFNNCQVWSGPVTVASIQDADGNEIGLKAGQGLAIVNALKTAKAIAWDPRAARTNSNRRTRGLLLDIQEETNRYAIPLGAPLSAPSPTGSNRDARDLEALISAARVRNSNMAITRLFNYADILRAYVKGNKRKDGIPHIEGMGRFLVKPFFEEHVLDLEKEISSLRDQDRAEDITSLLVNKIRDVSYRMFSESRYQPALNASAGGSQQAKLLIGTDIVLQRHLMVTGDTRTFGIAFQNHQIVSTFDERMKGKIVLAFTRDGQQDGPDPLSFGTHAWIPELASSIQVARDGATYPEAMVQPRNLHVNHLPIMAIIDVKGLSEVLASKITFPVQDVTPPADGNDTP